MPEAPAAQLLVVTTTLPSREEADRLARDAVTERLAACSQVQGPITSVYRWKGAIETATEWYCHLKTTESRFSPLVSRLLEWHPYDTPEIIAVPIVRASSAYGAWVAAEVEHPPES